MRLLAALVFAAAALSVRASTTNVVDVAALVAAVDAGISETNGWTLSSGLGKYNANCIKFDTKGDWIRSPDFGAPIIGLEVTVRCSSTSPTRSLHVLNGATDAELETLAPCGAKDKLEYQLLEIAPDGDVQCVTLKLDGSGNTGVWGIGAISVITAEPISAPTGLQVVHTNANSCVLEWVNDANTVSNRIDTYHVIRGTGEMTIFETDFYGFNGSDAQTKDFSGNVPEMLGDAFSGVRVYGAAGMTGVCQLGTGSSLGILRYAGLSSYDGISLRMLAKRYPGDNAATTIAYEHGGTTNEVETIVLPDDFGDIVVGLSAVPDGAAILLGYYKTKSNRRVLIDSMSIVRSSADVETLVDSRFVAAEAGAMSLSTRGVVDLASDATYRFDVFAQNGDGALSGVAFAEVHTLPFVPGFSMILR